MPLLTHIQKRSVDESFTEGSFSEATEEPATKVEPIQLNETLKPCLLSDSLVPNPELLARVHNAETDSAQLFRAALLRMQKSRFFITFEKFREKIRMIGAAPIQTVVFITADSMSSVIDSSSEDSEDAYRIVNDFESIDAAEASAFVVAIPGRKLQDPTAESWHPCQQLRRSDCRLGKGSNNDVLSRTQL